MGSRQGEGAAGVGVRGRQWALLALAGLGWSAGLTSWLSGGSDSPSDACATAHLAVASAAVVMLARARPAARPQLALLAGGLCAVAFATGALAYRALGGSFDPAVALFLGVPLGLALVALAVRRSASVPEME